MIDTLISLDWGGSNIDGCVFVKNQLVSEFKLDSANIRAISELKTKNIVLMIFDIAKLSSKTPIHWLIGAAGGSDPVACSKLRKHILSLSHKDSKAFIYTDAECNHASAFGGENGILSINGTGSIIYIKNTERSYSLGGAGFMLDEFPSAAFWGRETIKILVNHFDKTCLNNHLLELAVQKGFDTDKAQLLGKLYSHKEPQKYLASFAPLLAVAYENNIKTAKDIIEKSTDNLILLLTHAFNTNSFDTDSFVAIGGIWQSWQLFNDIFLKRALHLGHKFKICKPKYPLKFGPLLKFNIDTQKADVLIAKIKMGD